MNLVTIEHLTKSYTERLLFDDTAFSLNEGEKVGLIGVNGTGKSTLLKIVAGLVEPDGGTVVRGRSLYIRYLPQIPEFVESDTVLESVERENASEPHLPPGTSYWPLPKIFSTSWELRTTKPKSARCPADRESAWPWPACSSAPRTC